MDVDADLVPAATWLGRVEAHMIEIKSERSLHSLRITNYVDTGSELIVLPAKVDVLAPHDYCSLNLRDNEGKYLDLSSKVVLIVVLSDEIFITILHR